VNLPVPPRWVRRLVFAPAVVLLALGALTTIPFWLLLAAIVSPLLPGRWRPLRLLCFGMAWLVLEALGVLALFGVWIASGFGLQHNARRDAGWYRDVHVRLMRWFLDCVYWCAVHLFRLRIDISGPTGGSAPREPPESPSAANDLEDRRSPLLVLCRHAGPGDSFLLVHSLLSGYGRRPRIVLKDTLQLDPCIDILLHRLPSRFITPNPTAGAEVTAAIADLARGMSGDEALVIFPEGGNFTKRRRLRAIERLRLKGHDDEAEKAEAMTHLLAPRPGGTFAAVDAAPDADVVFVAHTGLEQLSSVLDIWRGIPMDSDVRARWWRVPAVDVPEDPEAQVDWLFAWWGQMDEWISMHRTAVP
jgi:1-acyl-sn-glycerol-3-phosphate acyltransferase